LKEQLVDEWFDLMKKATIDDIQRWKADIEADERGLFKRGTSNDLEAWATKWDIDRKYEALRKKKEDAEILKLLKLAGIQKTLQMSDEEFLERGKRAVKIAKQRRKKKKYEASKKKK
jgi:hypothetical protein